MKKLTILAAMLLALVGCGSDVKVDNKEMNKFLTDLSQAYMSDFNGPNPEDIVKIDFAVRRLVIDSPDAFTMQGKDMVIDADKVHAASVSNERESDVNTSLSVCQEKLLKFFLISRRSTCLSRQLR